MTYNKKIVALATMVTLGAVALQAKESFKVWHHATGNKAEITYIEKAVKRYNGSQDKYEVSKIDFIPEQSYTETLKAASLSGELACVFKVDQPIVPNLAWAKQVSPLDKLVGNKLLGKIFDGGKGVYNGSVYSVGQHDVSLALFTKKSILKKYDIRQATIAKPWTKTEFDAILKKLKASGDFKYPFDIVSGWSGEWASYAYAPFLQSFGGDEIDRKDFQGAEGVLNGKKGQQWAKWFSELFKKGYAKKRSDSPKGLALGDVAIQYIGSWEMGNLLKEIGSDELVVMPPVDFGNGPVVGNGSWHWALSSKCKNENAAVNFIQFLLKDSEIAELSKATKMLPTAKSATKLIPFLNEDQRFKDLLTYSEKFSIRRPETPAYPTITSVFEKLVFNLRDGADPQNALDEAVDAIEQDISDNNGYK